MAYVQLKPHQQVQEAELMAFLSERIAERAAMPKSITVIDEMPLTPVGKIFKPELRRRQVGQALQHALDEAGLQVRSVRIEADEGKRGVIAFVTMMDSRRQPEIAAVMDRFPFPYRLQ